VKLLSKLICVLAIVSTAFAAEDWANFTNPFPIRGAVPNADGLLLATAGGIRYRTYNADDMYTSANGLGDQSMSAVVVSDSLGVFSVSDNGVIATMYPGGSWQVLSRSYAGSGVRVIPGMVRLGGTVLTIAFESRLSFFNLRTQASILTVDRIADVNLSLTPVTAMEIRGDSLFVAVGSSLYMRKMDWNNLESDVQLYNPDSWKVVVKGDRKDRAIKSFAWKNGKLKTFTTEGTRIWDNDGETVASADTFSVFTDSSPYVVVRGKTLRDSVLYERKTYYEVHGSDSIPHKCYESKVLWVSLLPSGGAVLAGPNSIFYYDGKKISDLTEYKGFPIAGAYELHALPKGGVMAASEKGFFSFNYGYDWSEPTPVNSAEINGVMYYSSNGTDARGHNMKVLSLDETGTVFYHVWGQGFFMYGEWGKKLLISLTGADGTCMDDFFDGESENPFVITVGTTSAPDNMGFLTTTASSKGYSLVYKDVNENISCASNIGSAAIGGPIQARVNSDGEWVVYVGTRSETSLDAEGGLDVFTFPNPKQMGGGLDASRIKKKAFFGTSSTPLDLAYEPKTGYVWMVTGGALEYWAEDQDSLRSPLSTNGLTSASFTSIDVDPRGNLWVGTSSQGAYRLTPRPTNPDTLSVLHFTTRQGLLSDNIQDVAVDSSLGVVWFAHDNGISRYRRSDLRGSSGNMTNDANLDVRVYPIPFRPKLQPHIVFDNISEDAVINVYNRGGKLVQTLSGDAVAGGRAEWNGRMQNGNLVAPGVYQYVIRGASKVKKGKLLIIH
jgi:hypothetical protein